ncbi:MAG: 16S rRNA (cytosine(1402)-N(4))-methyltransferase RsmH [Synergistaceae bacterium]|nr:16S rRNA (cytosine(1402)-N(4))-methyltransferase RsmH [Synergistaceae bacterium]
MAFYHKPVLLDECIRYLEIKPEGTYIDCTVGGAGHASEILKRLNKQGRLLGIDRDFEAVGAARKRLEKLCLPAKFDVIHSNYVDIENICKDAGIVKADGILLDLGVSSLQLEDAERGFSYNFDAPLDMRMDRSSGFNAADVVNGYSERELTEVLTKYGEERWAVRISKFITERRKYGGISTTGELVDLIKAAVPKEARREGPHPAKRTFQAIRIEVNDEMAILDKAISNCVEMMNKNGRLCVITFHSLEDRILKNAYKRLSATCICPKGIPVCVCGTVPKLRIISKKPFLPSVAEIRENPRARSAKLRVAECL